MKGFFAGLFGLIEIVLALRLLVVLLAVGGAFFGNSAGSVALMHDWAVQSLKIKIVLILYVFVLPLVLLVVCDVIRDKINASIKK